MNAIFRGKPLPLLILVAEVTLGAYYLLAFRPLSEAATSLDRRLVFLHQRLISVTRTNAAVTGLDLTNFEARLHSLRAAAGNLAEADQRARDRVALTPEVSAQMSASFQLIDFQNARHQRTEEVTSVAKAKGVLLEPDATNGLPEYVVDMSQPALLWPQLHVASQLLMTAVLCRVSVIKSLDQLPILPHRFAAGGRVFFEELPMRIEVVGPMEAVDRFLTSLPLRDAELKSVNLADGLTNKPVMFIDQILLRKNSPTSPHEVRLDVVVCGLVPWVEEPIATLEERP